VLRTQSLLEEGEKNGDNDAGLQTFAEADEKDSLRRQFRVGCATLVRLPGTANTFGMLLTIEIAVNGVASNNQIKVKRATRDQRNLI
jgi:hypothetical protein